MDENKKLTTDDKIFDALLKAAAEDALNKDIDALPSKEELQKLYPSIESLDKKVYAVIKNETKAYRRKKTLRSVVKIAACFAIFLLVTSATLMSFEASRVFILNTAIEIRSNHIAFQFRPAGSTTTAGNIGEYLLEAMPEGFVLVQRDATPYSAFYKYVNDAEHRIVFTYNMSSESLSIYMGTTRNDFLTTELHGIKVHLFESKYGETHGVMWVLGDRVFMLASDIDFNIAVQLASRLIAWQI
ncbi:MAG: DUF4367 domain-containing protein [Defluviitaleaceae bacterium]|nr:DUF4367 domain-containing protein [Defluviitaleaceae bacterium]